MRDTLNIINELIPNGLIKDYAIGGAIAVLKWTEPFFTRDLDIFITYEVNQKEIINLTPIYEFLKKRGAQWEKQWIIVNGIPIDFIVADDLETEAIENAEEISYEGVKTKVLTPEYLIVLFTRAGRDKDIRKIEMLLKQTRINMEKLQMILKRYGLLEKFNKFKEKYYGE